MSAPLAIVLAAGKGTRMKSELPKVLVPVLGRPMIDYVLAALRAAGARRIVVVVGYRSDLVREHLAGEPDLGFVEQTEQLGTGHAVLVCRHELQNHFGAVIVVAGDSPLVQASSLRALVAEYDRSGAGCILGTATHENPHGLGRIVRDGQRNFQAIVEERDATDEQRRIREVNMSTYVFDGAALDDALARLQPNNAQREYYLTDVPGLMLAGGRSVLALGVLQACEALSINTLEQLAAVEEELKKQSAVSNQQSAKRG